MPESHIDQARDPAQGFVAKIERDRDQALSDIDRETKAEVRRIYAQAYRTARAFHRSASEQTRHHGLKEADRRTARAQARLRRESWRALRELQKIALTRLHIALQEMSRNPHQQWAWCHYWLRIARREAVDQALAITVGSGVLADVKARLEGSLSDYPGKWVVQSDPHMSYGIKIAWGSQLLDGRLESQHTYLADEVFKRLASALQVKQEGASD